MEGQQQSGMRKKNYNKQGAWPNTPGFFGSGEAVTKQKQYHLLQSRRMPWRWIEEKMSDQSKKQLHFFQKGLVWTSIFTEEGRLVVNSTASQALPH
jgi:hypothetical protein